MSPASRRWLLPVVAVVLTALAAGVVLWTLQTRQQSGPVVPVAIVNDDKPVTTGSGKDAKTVAAGRQLAAGLTQPDPKDQTPLSWQIVDQADATEGLRSGAYYAVLTIPADFSAGVTSTSGKTPSKATLTLVSNDASSAAVAALARLAVDQAAGQLGDQVTNNFTVTTLQNFTSIHSSLSSSATSAEQLNDSASQLASSSKDLDTSSQDLAEGADNLSTGADQLESGAAKLRSGARSAADGADSVATGSRRLATAADQLAEGAASSAAGAEKLEGSAERVARGTDAVAAGATDVSKATKGVATGAGLVERNARALSRGLDVVDRASGRSAQGTQNLARLTTRLSASCLRRTGDRVFCRELAAVTTDARVQARLAGVVDRGVSVGATSAGRVATRSGDLQDAAARVATRGGDLARAGRQVATGADALADGAGDLSEGTAEVSTGADRLGSSASSLASGAASVASGTASVASGAAENATGTADLATAAEQLQSGTAQLAKGTDQLASGADQLADGTDQLASGLKKGASSVPSYTDDQVTQIATVVTTPVGVQATAEPGSTVVSGLVPAVLAIALWLGTAMMFLTRGAVPAGSAWAQTTAGRRVLWGWVPALAVGAVQAVLLIGLVVLTGSPVHSLAGLGAFCALGVLAFAAINQALVSAFGRIGRLLTLALLLLQGAALGGLVPIQTAPALVQSLNQVLPLSQFVNGAGQLILGGASGGLLSACVVLVVWTAGALTVSLLTTARRHPSLAPGSLPPTPSPVPVAEPT